MLPRSEFLILLTVAMLTTGQPCAAQMVTTQAPLQTNSHSFYEQSSIGWSIHNPHYFISVNGGGGFPPFGGHQPNVGLDTGFAVGNDHFNLGFAQGSTLTSSTVAPVLTTTSGYPGFLFVGSQRPFVTGVGPVVGGAGFANVPAGPLAARIAAGEFQVENGRVIVPAIKKAQPAVDAVDAAKPGRVPGPAPTIDPRSTASESTSPARDLSATQYFDRAVVAEKEGRVGVARIYYQLAGAKGDPFMKRQAELKLAELKAQTVTKP